MPRVYNVGQNVDSWHNGEGNGRGASNHDVCTPCYADLLIDPHCHDDKLEPYNGDPQGDEGWQGESAPVSYDEFGYHCVVCGKPLTDAEDGDCD